MKNVMVALAMSVAILTGSPVNASDEDKVEVCQEKNLVKAVDVIAHRGDIKKGTKFIFKAILCEDKSLKRNDTAKLVATRTALLFFMYVAVTPHKTPEERLSVLVNTWGNIWEQELGE